MCACLLARGKYYFLSRFAIQSRASDGRYFNEWKIIRHFLFTFAWRFVRVPSSHRKHPSADTKKWFTFSICRSLRSCVCVRIRIALMCWIGSTEDNRWRWICEKATHDGIVFSTIVSIHRTDKGNILVLRYSFMWKCIFFSSFQQTWLCARSLFET